MLYAVLLQNVLKIIRNVKDAVPSKTYESNLFFAYIMYHFPTEKCSNLWHTIDRIIIYCMHSILTLMIEAPLDAEKAYNMIRSKICEFNPNIFQLYFFRVLPIFIGKRTS